MNLASGEKCPSCSPNGVLRNDTGLRSPSRGNNHKSALGRSVEYARSFPSRDQSVATAFTPACSNSSSFPAPLAGLTIRSELEVDVDCRLKMMRLPSGDHTALEFRPGANVNRDGLPPARS